MLGLSVKPTSCILPKLTMIRNCFDGLIKTKLMFSLLQYKYARETLVSEPGIEPGAVNTRDAQLTNRATFSQNKRDTGAYTLY